MDLQHILDTKNLKTQNTYKVHFGMGLLTLKNNDPNRMDAQFLLKEKILKEYE